MEIFDSIVIGAGQAGLAMSACLRMRGIRHVVLERARVAERWRAAPVRTHTPVPSVDHQDGGYRLETPLGDMWCRNVVVATGDLDLPRFPRIATDLPAGLMQLRSCQYRNPDQLPAGAVLVVGAGPSGQQIADELARTGAVDASGQPRQYRGVRDAEHLADHILGRFVERATRELQHSFGPVGVAA